MTDRPILFSAPMVRALLAGIKTQTRRALKGTWQSALEGHDEVLTWFAPPDVPWLGLPNQWAASGIYARKHGPRGYNRHLGLTPCRPGDRLWVREAWRAHKGYDALPPREMSRWPVHYEADGAPQPEDELGMNGRLRPGMFLPRWASRLTLTVTDVRVQRLQEISEADAWAEGCAKGHPDDVGGFFPAEEPHPSGKGWTGWDCARDWYADLWNRINGDDAWDANPWVVAYSFTVDRRNIAAEAP